MTTPAEAAELDALADTAAIDRARDAYSDAVAKLQAAEQAENEARAAVDKAAADRAALVLASASGQRAIPAATASAARAVQDAEHHLAFTRDLIAQLRAERQQREADVQRAQREAYRPVVVRGARLRLAAAQEMAVAQALLVQARREHVAGTAVLQHASARGLVLAPPRSPGIYLSIDVYEERAPAAERAWWLASGLTDADLAAPVAEPAAAPVAEPS